MNGHEKQIFVYCLPKYCIKVTPPTYLATHLPVHCPLLSDPLCPFHSEPWELRPVLCARSVLRLGADTLPPGHPHLLQAADQHCPLHSWEKTFKGHQWRGRGEWGWWGRRWGRRGGTCASAQHRNPDLQSHQPVRRDTQRECVYFGWRAGASAAAGGEGTNHTGDLEKRPAWHSGDGNRDNWKSALLLRCFKGNTVSWVEDWHRLLSLKTREPVLKDNSTLWQRGNSDVLFNVPMLGSDRAELCDIALPM